MLVETQEPRAFGVERVFNVYYICIYIQFTFVKTKEIHISITYYETFFLKGNSIFISVVLIVVASSCNFFLCTTALCFCIRCLKRNTISTNWNWNSMVLKHIFVKGFHQQSNKAANVEVMTWNCNSLWKLIHLHKSSFSLRSALYLRYFLLH